MEQQIKRQKGRPKLNIQQLSEKAKNKQQNYNILPQQETDIILKLKLSQHDYKTITKTTNEQQYTQKNILTSLLVYQKQADDMTDTEKIKYYEEQIQEKNKIIENQEQFINKYKSLFELENSYDGVALEETKDFLIENDENEDENLFTYDKINICFWDTCEFNTEPYYLEEDYKNGVLYVSRCFCSDNCKLAYNLDLNDDKMYLRQSLIKKFSNDKNIEPAPNKEILTKYGGCVSIEEYRRNFKYYTRKYRILYPPLKSIRPSIEIISREKTIKMNNINNNSSYKKMNTNYDSSKFLSIN